MTYRVAHLSVPKAGERENGDAVFVRQERPDRLMVAVIDGLGHGPSAAQASRAALARLASVTWELPLLEVVLSVHRDLTDTVGAAGTVCKLDGQRLEACAVGNVRLTSAGTSVPLIQCAGVLGRRVQNLRACACEFRIGSMLALYSDGLLAPVPLARAQDLSPEAACELLVAERRRRDDDATILILSREDS